MRIRKHPILEFKKGPRVTFTYDGQQLEGYEGEPIAAALHAAGIKTLSHSHGQGRPRGFFCAIGACSSCLMTVDGVPNVRVCVEKLRAGMRVETQQGKGVLR
ncbi:MAG: (2Fe-2S)-binding protein [Firmicutes bacterium]|nr:(2Fe-2S)-binding protein [Bacillota bacterium]